MSPRSQIFVPYDVRFDEPREAMPIEQYEADRSLDQRIIATARNMSRVFAKIEISVVIGFALYIAPQVYAGLARQGVFPW